MNGVFLERQGKYCSLKPILSPYDLEKPVNWEEQFGRCAPLEVEIGFGMGEVLMRMARQMPDRNFVGIEKHWQRIYKTLKAMTREQSAAEGILENIRILNVDARVCFERIFAPKSIETVYCLFPCPWPKKGHIKNRLFSNNFLRLLNSRLKPSGELKIVTDFQPYHNWILGQISRTGFQVKEKKVSPQYGTKFERKWREEGQEKFFELNLTKKRHIDVPVKKDVLLKNYVLNEFNADHLQLNDAKGETSVIFKSKIFDKEKQKIMIHTIVAEDHLIQHFWITISKSQNKWNIAKSEGQNFFPTDGIAKALGLVYQAACETQDHHLYA